MRARTRAHTHTHAYIYIYIYIYTHTHTTMPNNHNLHSTITQKLLKYTDLKEELFGIWRLKTTYVLPLPTTGIIPNKLHESLKPFNP